MKEEQDSPFEREQLATAIAFSEGTSVDMHLMTARRAVSADVITAVEARSTEDCSRSLGEVKAAETQNRFTSDFHMSTNETHKPPNQEESSDKREHQDNAFLLSDGNAVDVKIPLHCDHSHNHSCSTDVTSRKQSSPSFMFIEGDAVDLNLSTATDSRSIDESTARSDSSTDVSTCRSPSSDVLTARSDSSDDVSTAHSGSSSDAFSARKAFEESNPKSPTQKSRFTSDFNMQLTGVIWELRAALLKATEEQQLWI